VDKHGPLVRRTPNLITDTAELHRELELSRRRGYALDDQESDPPGSTASPSPSTSPPTRSRSAPSASRPCRTATPLRVPIAAADDIRALIVEHLGDRALPRHAD
jgi:IclR family transcriptional regulator, acetate operon repressor